MLALVTGLMHGTEHKIRLIEWKKTRNMYNKDSPLLRRAYFSGLLRRNSRLETRMGNIVEDTTLAFG